MNILSQLMIETEVYVSGAVTENCHIKAALSSACLNIFS
jgi:hypothetical protein